MNILAKIEDGMMMEYTINSKIDDWKIINMPEQVQKVWKLMDEFVHETCKDRDESHGYSHMKTVAVGSMKIFCEILNQSKIPFSDETIYLSCLITIVAWLHDVFDHKYPNVELLKTKTLDYLKSHLETYNIELIMNIINCLSYSKENKLMKTNPNYLTEWKELLGTAGMIVRDIVSDADKLEALGKIGYDRCREYTISIATRKLSEEEIREIIISHANEKLFRLRDEFICTGIGYAFAVVLHDELAKLLICNP